MATENDSLSNLTTSSLTSAMRRLMLDTNFADLTVTCGDKEWKVHRLMLDTNFADLTVTCGDKEWKVHTNILAIRSPFFQAAVTNNMAEKLQMKIDIKDFDPKAMEEVLNFMYGVHKENGSVQFLFEAAERFQMADLKEYAVELARKEMTVSNVVELGNIAELYGIEGFLADCAKFIVKNDVPLTSENISPKLAVLVVSILKDANQKLKGKLQDCESELKVFFIGRDVAWTGLRKINLNGQILEYVGSGVDICDGIVTSGYGEVGLAQAKTPLETSSNYFEIEIIDPGSCCSIAIGLAKKDYPINRFPGWNQGSIGYHGDDGKVYMASSVGAPFGPLCNKGDIMGCGIIFSSDYKFKSDSEDDQEVNKHSGKMVHVYFTRNGKVIGKKEVALPKEGFFPTVGMMSYQAKVRVNFCIQE